MRKTDAKVCQKVCMESTQKSQEGGAVMNKWSGKILDFITCYSRNQSSNTGYKRSLPFLLTLCCSQGLPAVGIYVRISL